MTKFLMDNLNEEQRYAVHFNGKHLLVLAGAGTGKTHTIISRARKLIEEDGVDPKRIVILSFTRKSAPLKPYMDCASSPTQNKWHFS